jgi:class 3 adenylate cyclase/CHASE2 domain-containing sensor protein
VKWKASPLVPALICAGVTACFCLLEWLGETQPRVTFFKRLEWITYDWRVREAARHSSPVATNLGFVAMDERSIDAVLNGSLPYRFGLLWPRQVYGRLVDELSAQGANVVGLDVLFSDLRPDHKEVETAAGNISSDNFFANSLRRSGKVFLATEEDLFPPELFATNALGVAHISAQPERDGILRRTHAFIEVREWHPAIKTAERELGWDLNRFKVGEQKLLFPRQDGKGTNSLPLNAEGQFNVGLLERKLAGNTTRPVIWRLAPPFRDHRLWHLGLAMAARELKLDLNQAVVDFGNGRIVLSNTQGVQRVLPVDHAGRFYINWSVGWQDPRLTKRPIEHLLNQYEARRAGRMDEVTNEWAGKLVVVGSTASGNNLSDRGATPLEQHTYLVSDYWNVANSVLMDRFVHPTGFPTRLLIIVLFGALSGFLTLNSRTLVAVGSIASVGLAYVVIAIWLFIQSGIWLPLVMPVAGSLVVTHVSLITYLVRVERRLRRHTKEIFSRVVSPDIVSELLDQKKLRLGGARRRVTIFFADIRGFTEVTDHSRQRAEEFVAQKNWTGADAERHFDSEAEAVLNTVNPYLGAVADVIKKHGGSLDKYIGDCVMAFWGAPTANPRHAVGCVRAAIEAQRAVLELNHQRQAENNRRVEENFHRAAAGQNLLPLLDILTLGSGINTGAVTVGMVGSEAHQMNYTVFGREVNLASRLEGASGRARILIGEETHRELLRDDPELASLCIDHPPLTLKGFRDTVKAYEVLWRPKDVSGDEAGQTMTIIRSKTQREMPY